MMEERKNGAELFAESEGVADAITAKDADTDIGLISIPDQSREIEKIIQRTEDQIKFFNRIKIISLKLTKSSDWVIQRGKGGMGSPYLMDRGAENIRIAWGVDISGLKLAIEWAEDEKGKYYTYVATGKAYSKKLSSYIEDIGVCSQRDKFFGMIGTEFKQIDQVDSANIRRKAVTNLYNRLIKRMTGTLNVTLEDLAEAGFDVAKMTAIEYADAGSKTAKINPEAERQRSWIKECALSLAKLTGGGEKEAKELIKAVSFFEKDGKPSFVDDIDRLTSEKWIAVLYGKFKGMLKEKNPVLYAKMFPDEVVGDKAKSAKKTPIDTDES